MSSNIIERSGQFVVDAEYDAVFDVLADPETMAGCLPDEVNAIEPRGDGSVDTEIVVGVSAIRTRMTVRLCCEETDADAGRIVYVGTGAGFRSEIDMRGQFDLDSTDDRVSVSWTGGVTVGGLLASLGATVGRIDTIAADKIDRTAENVQSLF